MSFESLTDENISELIKCPKTIKNLNVRVKTKDGSEHLNYELVGEGNPKRIFEVYKRQNMRAGMKDDFSCGISWISPTGERLTLMRYNGGSHSHPNHLEKERLPHACHIHVATERYIRANRKAEGYAEETARYNDLQGAFDCLAEDCNITNAPRNRTSQFSLDLWG